VVGLTLRAYKIFGNGWKGGACTFDQPFSLQFLIEFSEKSCRGNCDLFREIIGKQHFIMKSWLLLSAWVRERVSRADLDRREKLRVRSRSQSPDIVSGLWAGML